MATIHTGTTLVPSKLELLADWLPRQPWYRTTGRPPEPSRAGGFRLDDPAGEVGIEFLIVTDGTAEEGTTYAVPLSYRGAPLAGADAGLVGTTEHGVLGRRWVYDGARDPVVVTQLLDFVAGRTEAQHQSRSDTPDPSVGRSWTGGAPPVVPDPPAVSETGTGTSVDLGRLVLELVRIPVDGAVAGNVEVNWTRPDGTPARGAVVVVR
ncbi:MAG TPA: 1,4-alpha-glucan branching protein [Blastococcus sp.]|nr:1,4-alpha-glucan branching protein [Blastococcus sp.]